MLQLRLGKISSAGNYKGNQLVVTNTGTSLPNSPLEILGWVEKRSGLAKGRRSSTFIKTSRLEYWLSKGIAVHPSVSKVLVRSDLHSKIFRNSSAC
jgi:ribosomal protein S16